MAKCPCPRCLVRLKDCHQMGMVRDMKRRKKKARKDNIAHRRKVKKARQYIYSGKSLKSQAVKDLLGDESLVPTLVG